MVDKRFQIYEIHANLDLDEHEKKEYRNKDGIELPYVITVDKGTGKVLVDLPQLELEDDSLKAKRQHFVHYGYIPGFGFYYFGLIHLIGGHARAATSLLRQLVDCRYAGQPVRWFQDQGHAGQGGFHPHRSRRVAGRGPPGRRVARQHPAAAVQGTLAYPVRS